MLCWEILWFVWAVAWFGTEPGLNRTRPTLTLLAPISHLHQGCYTIPSLSNSLLSCRQTCVVLTLALTTQVSPYMLNVPPPPKRAVEEEADPGQYWRFADTNKRQRPGPRDQPPPLQGDAACRVFIRCVRCELLSLLRCWSTMDPCTCAKRL